MAHFNKQWEENFMETATKAVLVMTLLGILATLFITMQMQSGKNMSNGQITNLYQITHSPNGVPSTPITAESFRLVVGEGRKIKE